MRGTDTLLLLLIGALAGCASMISPSHNATVSKPDVQTTHPYIAGLYLGPEIVSATASVLTPDGDSASVAMGDYLRSALVRSAKRVFADVVVVQEPILDQAKATGAAASEIWPAEKAAPPAPDVLIVCNATYLKGHTQGQTSCDGCERNLSFRVAISFEILERDGSLLGRGTVSGHGLTRADGNTELPLTASFRGAMAEAGETLSGHLSLALSSTPIPAERPLPDASREPEQYAERESGEEAM